MKVGLISFTDPRKATAYVGEREGYIRAKHAELKEYLEKQGFDVVDPMVELRSGGDEIFGIQRVEEVQRAIKIFQQEGTQAIIIGCWHWTEPQLPLMVVRALDLPTLLFTEDDPTWAGSVHISATGASLWEVGVNLSALRHERVLGDKEQVARWARGACALSRLREAVLVLWGGSYCLRMEHLQDDIPTLKSFIIGDIITEGEYILINRAEEILSQEGERIDKFIKWLEKGGTKIEFDEQMLTEEVLRKQVALYLAARDRLGEVEGDVLGVSVKCQPELSEIYGVDGCFLPAFLPFPEDSEGKRDIVPTVCEGDIKGLLTCAALFAIDPDTPPLFGDLKYVGRDYIIISNCGASSVYYSCRCCETGRMLKNIWIRGQCQGVAGGAVGYFGEPGELTVARLVRVGGEYFMQLGRGEAIKIDEKVTSNIRWGDMWPHIAIDLGVDPKTFVRAAGSNHYCATVGDRVEELKHLCRQAGIGVVDLNDEEELNNFVDSIGL